MSDDDYRPDPIEPEVGQDDEPPDLLLATVVAVRLLHDLAEYLDDEGPRDDRRAELLLRIFAVAAVLRRIRERLESEGP